MSIVQYESHTLGIGYDIIHEHPNCDGGKLGATSYRDFLIFAHAVANLEHGRALSFGSAVMAAGDLSEGAVHGAQRSPPGPAAPSHNSARPYST